MDWGREEKDFWDLVVVALAIELGIMLEKVEVCSSRLSMVGIIGIENLLEFREWRYLGQDM